MKTISLVSAVILYSSLASAGQVSGTAGIWGKYLFPYIPPETRFTHVAAAGFMTYAISTEGQVYFWGYGHGLPERPVTETYIDFAAQGLCDWEDCQGVEVIGLRADGTAVVFGPEIEVLHNLNNIVAISGSDSHFMALRSNGTVEEWSKWEGLPPIPSDLSDVAAIAAGGEFSMALLSNGTVRVWGDWWGDDVSDIDDVVGIAAHSYDALLLRSDGTVVSATGDELPESLDNVVEVVTSADGSVFALKNDGTVVAWGDSDYGAPFVPEGLSNVVKIAAGLGHAIALKADGTIAAWGLNDFGQSLAPEDMRRVVSASAGFGFSMLVKQDGTVMPVGLMNWLPAWVPDGLDDVVQVAAGESHVLALRRDGTVVAWGDNRWGQCDVPPTLGGIKAVAAGGSFSMSLREDGTVVTWGRIGNEFPQPPGLSGIIQIAAGYDHAIALKNNGAVVVWGSITMDEEDVLESPIIAVAALDDVTLALTEDGNLEMLTWHGWTTMNTPGPVVKMGAYDVIVTADGKLFWDVDGSETFFEPPQNLPWVSSISGGFDHRILIVSEPSAPIFAYQPEDQISERGRSVTLFALAEGAPILNFQWQKDGTDIPGATSRRLVLEDVGADDAGAYQVVARNDYGSTASRRAIVMVPRLENALASSLLWRTGGDGEWFAQTQESTDGLAAMIAGLGENEEAWIETVVYGPGTLNFSWKISSQAESGVLDLLINEEVDSSTSGTTDWSARDLVLGSGRNVIRWRFSNGASAQPGSNAAWLDVVQFIPEIPAAVFTLTSSISPEGVSLQLNGETNRGYILQGSTDLINWFSITSLSSDDGLAANLPLDSDHRFYRAITP